MVYTFYMRVKAKRYSSGQTLLEAVIALSILVIILGAVSVVVLTSLNNSSYIKQQNQANKLAQQGIEYIRDQIDNSGNNRFQTYDSYALNQVNCLIDISQPNPLITRPCQPGEYIQGTFKREVTFIPGYCGTGNAFSNGITATVNVYWTNGTCSVGNQFCHKQQVSSCFLDPAKNLPAGATPGV